MLVKKLAKIILNSVSNYTIAIQGIWKYSQLFLWLSIRFYPWLSNLNSEVCNYISVI